MEYDSEYMQKHNEDLNTTLIFVCFCFLPCHHAALTAFLRLVCSPPSAPHSSSPSSQNLSQTPASGRKPISEQFSSASTGPSLQTKILPLPQRGTVPLYVSLLMSLLAAFIAMLGKQWLNRYLRHTGGSVIERCGDRQRKFDGLRNGPSAYSWKVSPPCSRLPSFSSPVACRSTCGRSTSPSPASLHSSLFSKSSSTLGSWLPVCTSSYEGSFQTSASMLPESHKWWDNPEIADKRLRQTSPRSSTPLGGTSRSCWRAYFCLTAPRLSTPLG